MAEEWTEFGWQGLQVAVPPDWELVGLPKNHDPAEGYLRLDDGISPRLEVKWRAHPQKKFDIGKTLDDYVKSIKKQYEKDVGAIEIRRDQAIIPRVPEYDAFFDDKEVSFFSWRAAWRAYGVIWRCRSCHRVVMAQAIAPSGEQGHRQTALRAISGLACHTARDANLWTAYGLSIRIPRSFRLNKLKLLNGYSLFTFTDGTRDVAVERYGLADQQLRGATLEEWYRRTYDKSLRGTYFLLEHEDEADSGICVSGRTKRSVDLLDRWDVGVVRGWDTAFRRVRFHTRAWRDPEANRINVVRATGKQRIEALVDRIVDSADERNGRPRAGVAA